MDGKTRAENPVLAIQYILRSGPGRERTHTVRLDAETLDLIQTPPDPAPEWTALEFHRCPHCPLEASRHARCPVALNLAPVLEAFSTATSYDEVQVLVTGPERFYGSKTTLQEVAGALVGIAMVTSGCPILDRMRPLVRTHLPFASNDEHAYRMTCMYLYAQYLNHRRGRAADWDLAGLAAYYEQVETVNRFLCKRLNAVRVLDSDVGINAVNVLNASMSLSRLALEEEDLTPWAALFERQWGTPVKKESPS